MWVCDGADTLTMVLFPPEFPFVRRAAEPIDDAPSAEPIVEAAADEPQAAAMIAEAIADEVAEPSADEASERARLMMFPAEFPFVRRAPEAPADVPETAATALSEVAAPIIEAAASHGIASVHETTPETNNRPPVPSPVATTIAVPIATTAAAQAPAVSASEMRMRERRKVKRDPMSSQALVRLDGVHGPPMKVELTDISVAGVRFRAPRGLDAGEKGQIRLEIGPLRWTTRLRVVYSTSNTEGPVTIGCAFLRTELLRPWPLTAA